MRRFLPMLLALLLPACSGHGAEGIPAPDRMNILEIERPRTPNTALAAPSDFRLKPDIETHRYKLPPEELYALLRRVAEGQPRTFPHAAYPDRLQAHFVVRSAVFNFPDLVTFEVGPDSTLIIWSRSVYGESDLGVNRKRLAAWLAALDAALPAS